MMKKVEIKAKHTMNFDIIVAHPYIFALLVLWTVVWKGLALWRAAQRDSKAWFIVLLVINTVGVLEILYLYVFSKPKRSMETGPVSV